MPFFGHDIRPLQTHGDLRRRNSLNLATPFSNSLQRAKPATKRELTQFHSDDYVDFLHKINPSNMGTLVKEQHKCKFSLACKYSY